MENLYKMCPVLLHSHGWNILAKVQEERLKKKIFSYPGKENGLKRDGVEREILKKKVFLLI